MILEAIIVSLPLWLIFFMLRHITVTFVEWALADRNDAPLRRKR